MAQKGGKGPVHCNLSPVPCNLASVNPLPRRPTGDGYWQVFHSRPAAWLAVHQRVSQKLRIVPLRKVRTLMGATRLSALQGGLYHALGNVEHEREFDGGNQFGVEHLAAIVESDVAESFLQLVELNRRASQRIARAVDSGAFLHRGLHLLAQGSDTLAAPRLLKELVLQSGLLIERLSQRVAAWRLLPCRESRRRAPRSGTEHEQLGQRIGTKPVSAINADASHLARGIEALERRSPFDVGVNAAHHVVNHRPNWDQLLDRIDILVFEAQLPNKGKFGIDYFLSQVPKIEVNHMPVRPFEGVAFLLLLDKRLGQAIA